MVSASYTFGVLFGVFLDQKVDEKIDAEIDAKQVSFLMKNRCKNGMPFWYFPKFAFVKNQVFRKGWMYVFTMNPQVKRMPGMVRLKIRKSKKRFFCQKMV